MNKPDTFLPSQSLRGTFYIHANADFLSLALGGGRAIERLRRSMKRPGGHQPRDERHGVFGPCGSEPAGEVHPHVLSE